MFTMIYHYLPQEQVIGFYVFLLVGLNIALCFLDIDYKWLWRIGITLFGCDLIGIFAPEHGLFALECFAAIFGGLWFIKWIFSGWEEYENFFFVFWW